MFGYPWLLAMHLTTAEVQQIVGHLADTVMVRRAEEYTEEAVLLGPQDGVWETCRASLGKVGLTGPPAAAVALGVAPVEGTGGQPGI